MKISRRSKGVSSDWWHNETEEHPWTHKQGQYFHVVTRPHTTTRYYATPEGESDASRGHVRQKLHSWTVFSQQQHQDVLGVKRARGQAEVIGPRTVKQVFVRAINLKFREEERQRVQKAQRVTSVKWLQDLKLQKWARGFICRKKKRLRQSRGLWPLLSFARRSDNGTCNKWGKKK